MPDYHYQRDIRAFSQVLEDIGAKDDPKLYMGELVNAFGERGFGALMLLLGLISALIGGLPGTTTILGVPIFFIALQLVIRSDQLWLPRWALKRSIDRETYRSAIAKALKPLRSVERLSKPRLSIMTSELSEILIGLACILLCAILVLPIPGGNLVPSLIIVAFGFGLVQRDGLAIVIAWTAIAIICAGAVTVWLAWEQLSPYLTPLWTWLTGLLPQAWTRHAGLF